GVRQETASCIQPLKAKTAADASLFLDKGQGRDDAHDLRTVNAAVLATAPALEELFAADVQVVSCSSVEELASFVARQLAHLPVALSIHHRHGDHPFGSPTPRWYRRLVSSYHVIDDQARPPHAWAERSADVCHGPARAGRRGGAGPRSPTCKASR